MGSRPFPVISKSPLSTIYLVIHTYCVPISYTHYVLFYLFLSSFPFLLAHFTRTEITMTATIKLHMPDTVIIMTVGLLLSSPVLVDMLGSRESKNHSTDIKL